MFLWFIWLVVSTAALPSDIEYRSLAGLSDSELELFMRGFHGRTPGASPAPGPLADDRPKLVNDAAHPWKPLRPDDIRGPCPGLNTLASHGYLPRNGIATPQQIVNAVQEGEQRLLALSTVANRHDNRV